MNLHRSLQERHAQGRPLRMALIGAGKFGSMFLSQLRVTPGMHLVAVADLAPERARGTCGHRLAERAHRREFVLGRTRSRASGTASTS
ncbi:MAG TPA: hypothetical protein VLU54_12560 [Casimicrobiaceae bacterium]|nr:hypothetical protein [Casimicrobiaceae bacterium]